MKTTLADHVLHRTINTSGPPQTAWIRIRRLLVRILNDPPCTVTVHGRTLKLPLSHELPTYLKLLPFYDRLPERLGRHLHETYGPLTCVDVGANVGDSIAAVYRDERDRFLDIEPDPKFNHYLHENWDSPAVRILDRVCSSQSGLERYEIVEKFGTASFYKNIHGAEYETASVDDLLKENPEFARPHLIKIDTDGHDFAVIAGAKQALKAGPAVLFECDVFGNTRHVQDCLETLALFDAAGYRSMLVYEKFGYLLGRYELHDLVQFRDLLDYQLANKFMYYDILLMKEGDLLPFYAGETSFFTSALAGRDHQS